MAVGKFKGKITTAAAAVIITEENHLTFFHFNGFSQI